MSNDVLTATQFRDATNHAVRAVLNLYGEVNALFQELTAALGGQEPSLAPLTAVLRPRPRKTHYEDRILPRWTGCFYRPDEGDDSALVDDQDEDSESEIETEIETKGRRVILPWGGTMVFARVIVYQHRRLDWEPTIQFGVLTNARVAAGNFPKEVGLNLRGPHLRAILYDIAEEPGATTKNELQCRRLKVPPIKGLSASPAERALQLSVPCQPISRPLFSIDSPEQIASIAAEMSQLWLGHGA